jgi:hypothetical protein
MNNSSSEIVKELVNVVYDFCDLVKRDFEFQVSKEETDELVDAWGFLEEANKELYRRVPKKKRAKKSKI